jgi:hypothetical protein
LRDSMVYCPDCSAVFHRFQHLRSWSSASLVSYLTDKGFSVIEVGTVDFSSVHVKMSYRHLKNLVRNIILGPPKKLPHLYAVCAVNQ